MRFYLGLVVLGALPLVGVTVYAERLATAAIERHVRAANENAAEITRELVERDFEHWVGTLDGFSRLPGLVAAVRDRDEDAVRRRLEVLVESKRRVERAFVTDASGLLWSDFPRAPESLGKRFDHRDWYRGLSRSWRPYVSRVYRRHAEPRPLLVAIAAPIREAPDGAPIGAVVYQVRLEDLTLLLRDIEVGDGGFVFLVDHAGVIAAHPRLDLQASEHDEVADAAPIRAAREDEGGTVRYVDPFAAQAMLATAARCEVQGQPWVVVAQQSERAAYGPIRALRWQIAGAGALLALIVGALCVGLARSHERVRAANTTLEGVNRQLVHENAERIRAEQELQRSHDELEERVEQRTRELRSKEEQLLHAQKMEAVGRLAGGVAHDFNNLLSVIIGYGHLVLKDLAEDAPHRRPIQEMHDAGERAAGLTRQLLAFSRKQVLKPRALDLNAVVERMERMLRRIIGEDIELSTRLEPGLPPVMFDPSQIEQIVANLAVNARDAMPQGGKLTIKTARVVLDADYARSHADAREGPHVVLAVTDTGVGMDAPTQARIFEPFFTTKETGRGTGLGLSTVYGIVKQSGGNIWVYSEVGRGTTFKVYLPAADEPAAPSRAPATEAALPRGSETILVVEDEPTVSALIVMVLESSGYTVLSATNGDEALAVARDVPGKIDLLLTDVVLPGQGGPQIAAALRALRPDARVLFMSGYTDDAIVHHGVLAEGTAFLEKPIRPRALLDAVRDALTRDE